MSDLLPSEFEKAAARQDKPHFAREFLAFLRHNKKWWLLPIVLILLALSALLLLSGSALAPFVYTLF
jgi:hypothetical protein